MQTTGPQDSATRHPSTASPGAGGPATSPVAPSTPGTPAAPLTALVTGAGRGIGRGIAVGLVERGWSVALLGRSPGPLAETEAACREAARTVAGTPGTPASAVVAVTADVTVRAEVAAAVARVEAAFAGLGGIGLVVNNAGVAERQEVDLAADDPDDAWRVIETNLRGPLLVAHAVLPGMLARGSGRLVGLNSGAGHRLMGTMTGYAISKNALARLTALLDHQYRDRGLRTLDVAPGVVRTDMTTGMAMHTGRTEWTPVQATTALVDGFGRGALDALSGRQVRAGADTVESLRAATEDILAADARRIRLVGYEGDPIL